MLVNPVQQSPLAYDPARQQLTPPAQVVVTTQSNPADLPIQPGQTPQDKFNPQDGGGGSRKGESGQGAQDPETVSDQLRAAWERLEQLKQQAAQALIAGNAKGAKEAAQQAADVAISIQNLTGGSPQADVSDIETAADDLAQKDSDSTTDPDADDADSDTPSPAVIDIARAGLGAANAVVDTAASIPSHPAEDRTAINGYKQTVLDAIAGVEAIATQYAGVGSLNSGGGVIVDIRA
jgi:hypothetical protein